MQVVTLAVLTPSLTDNVQKGKFDIFKRIWREYSEILEKAAVVSVIVINVEGGKYNLPFIFFLFQMFGISGEKKRKKKMVRKILEKLNP